MATFYHGSNFEYLEYEKIKISDENTDPLKMQSGPGFYVSRNRTSCRTYGINIYEVFLNKGFRLKKKRPTKKQIKEFMNIYFHGFFEENFPSKLYADAISRGIEHIYIEIFMSFAKNICEYQEYCELFSKFFQVDGIILSYPNDSVLVIDPSKVKVFLSK